MGCLDFLWGTGTWSSSIEIGNYSLRLKRVIGTGGFATVHLAEGPEPGKPGAPDQLFAVKRVLASNEEQSRLARREVECLRKFASPHTLRLLAWSASAFEGEVALVLPFCAGGSLRERLDSAQLNGTELDPFNAIRWMKHTALALAVLHGHDPPYAHRDVKPENVLLDSRGENAFLCDFGSCVVARRIIGSRQEALELQDDVQEQTSPPFRAPELFEPVRGTAVDESVDVWAFGCMLYACIFLVSPFERTAQLQGGSLELAIQNGSFVLDDDTDQDGGGGGGGASNWKGDLRSSAFTLIRRCLEQEAHQRSTIRSVVVGVVGTGTMGSGIAQQCASVGMEVIIWGRSKASTSGCVSAVRRNLGFMVTKGKIAEQDGIEAIGRLRTTSMLQDLARCSVVVECVVEDYSVKKEVVRALAKVLDDDAIVMTNTSSLSVTKLASYMKQPQNFVGVHFFNPVPLMSVCEVARGLRTSDETHQRAIDFVARLGKKPIDTRDSPGFIVNRLLIPMINDAATIAQERVASVADIDSAMKRACNFPMGPLALADMIGLDVVLATLLSLQRETGQARFAACLELRKKVEAGFLGRKTGRGFYQYDDDE